MKFPIPRTLHARLILSHLLVALIGIILISAIAGQSIFNASREQVQNSYEDLAFAATNDLEQPLLDMLSGQGSPDQVRAVIDKWFSHIPDLRYSLYLPGGEPLVGSGVELPAPADPGSDPEIWTPCKPRSVKGRRSA
jgi:hypothetical protein